MKLPRLKISFGELKMNRVVKFFILSDFLFWGGWGLLSPIFAVFILQRLGSANVFTVGAAAALYYLTKAVAEVPISFYLDKHEGEKDDFHALLLGLLLGGCVSLIFLSIRSLPALFLSMIVQGVAFALYSSSWPAIFSRHLDKDHFSLEWTMDHFGIDLISAGTAFLGGSLALFLGFNFIFILAAAAAFTAVALLFFVPDLILPKETLKEPILRDHVGPTIGK
ncbi:MFS transporter [Patescibacteria group bacterium]|nr:MFS transporter [Patescibacteria group bacterium]